MPVTDSAYIPDYAQCSLYELVRPESLPSWVRVRAANALATGGAAWADVVARHNSGTYNNQYMVVDVGAFARGRRGMQR